jgi:O-methyltransferase involved in polyketide biosynthesis
MEQAGRAPGKVDVDGPSTARIYDYFLGGAHNFEVDRQAADELAELHPVIGRTLRANRSYLRRVVNFLTEAGIDQFLDLGSGIPTVGNVHEIAQRLNPDATVVYVDVEPVVVTHSNTILAGNDRAVAIEADLCRPDDVLGHPDTVRLLDLSRPVAVICTGVLQYVTDEQDPVGVLAGYRDRIAPGSYLALAHPSEGERNPAWTRAAVADVYRRTPPSFTLRCAERFAAFFAGLDLVEPGVSTVCGWRAEPDASEPESDDQASSLAGVGRKP